MKRITKIEQICISCSFPNEAYTNEFKFAISPILKTDILYDYINFSLSQIICLLSNAGPLGGGVYWGSQNSKCQVPAKFSFLGGGGYSWVVKFRIGILAKTSKNFAMPYSGSSCILETNKSLYSGTTKELVVIKDYSIKEGILLATKRSK